MTTKFLTGLVSALLVSIITPVMANSEKRVTVPIALPFQQQASSAAASVAAVQGLQTTPFTQTLAASSVPLVQPRTSTVSSVATTLTAAVLTPSMGVIASSVAASSAGASSVESPVAVTSVQSTAIVSAPEPQQAQSEPQEVQAKDETPTANVPLVTTAPVDAPRYPEGHPEAFVAEFEDYVAKKVAPFVPGVAIVVISGGQVKSLQGYGVRRAGTRETLTPDTVFRLASLSKPFAATAASELVNEGKISWDTTVTSVLPDVAFKNARYGKQLTFRNILSQASGLPRHTYSHFIDENMSFAEIVRRLRYVNFSCAPGKCYAYQNVSYSLAGEMIKKKSGMSFEKYVEKNVFDPLGMRTASYGLNNYNASPNRAAPHISNGKRWIPTAVTPNWYRVAPAAGVNASIVDMSKFLLGQMGKRPEALPLAVLNPIQSRVTKNTPAQNYYGERKAVGNTAYGMGWRVFDYGRYKNFVHHGGHVKGFRTEMVFNRDLQIGMVFLTNSESRFAKDIIFKFLDMYEQSHHPVAKSKKIAKKQ
ncbi:MAG: serine hydrolase [Cellvibrio sp. 79]|nr:MAG: serine hydrolase [Cellvibrio sp. 79]